MIFLEGLHLIPVTFLMIAGAFRRMDPALEEASAVAGGGMLRTLMERHSQSSSGRRSWRRSFTF